METILIISGVGALALAAFAIRDSWKMAKASDAETVYYCRECEQINTTEECPICCRGGARIARGTAYKVLSDTNVSRLMAWRDASRIIPEVE